MIIRNLASVTSGDASVTSAKITWEDQAYPDQELFFEIQHGGGDEVRSAGADGEPCADAFLAACFPLASVHGEARVRIEGQPCPMLVEGLRTAHTWWASWGGMRAVAPEIDIPARWPGKKVIGERRGVVFL